MTIAEREDWYRASPEEVLEDLETNSEGLTNAVYQERLTHYGPNALPAKEGDSLLRIFFRQFESPLIYLLLCASALMLVLQHYTDAGIIAFVLFVNAIAGTIQAGRAQNTMLALQRIAKTTATVLRNGVQRLIDDRELVPGDIILLAEGDKIPADARLLQSRNLRLNQSALTGESNPVGKEIEAIDKENLPAADQKNMVFKGTFVVAGSAKAVVTSTALDTVVGKISKQIGEIQSEIPLQKNIRRLSHYIIYVVLVISALIFLIGAGTGKPMAEMFTLAVAVIVSAVPEGLPIVMTLLLASGVWRMSKRNVLVKNLQAVEALGEAKIIAVDKTGTITKNELSLTSAYIDNQYYTITGVGYDPVGTISVDGQDVTSAPSKTLHWSASVAALCSNAVTETDNETGQTDIQGDPTEAAMLVFAKKLGLNKTELLKEFQLLDEIPFDSSLQFHALRYQQGDRPPQLLVAGAPEQVLARATHIHHNGEVVELTDELRQRSVTALKDMAEQALRVIAIAERTDTHELTDPEQVHGLTLVGLLGLQDGLRPEVPEAMDRTREAGIKVVMITGDHKDTAEAIAAAAGIFRPGDTVLTNDDIDRLSEAELAAAIGTTTVFARITPEHKLAIVKAFQARGDIVAMTGDGVNDALSLVAADLGVAMGQRGTEVAKEAADLVLLDDNFGSIVSAVEEGRGIYANIKKVLLFLFSTSLGEVFIILIALILLIPAPVLAAQLIWINLVTDGFLDMALAMEPKEKDLLRRKFVKPKRFFFDGWMIQRMLIMSSVMAVGSISVFLYYYQADLAKAMTLTVTVMVVCQWFKVWSCRTQYESAFSLPLFSNLYIIGALGLVIVLHVLALHTPFLQNLLQFQPISAFEWILAIAIGSLTLVADEIRKFIYRRFQNK